MAVVGAKAKDGFGGPGMGIPGNGNNYTKHQIKCHEVSRPYLHTTNISLQYPLEDDKIASIFL